MISEEFQIISESGVELFGRSWLPESPIAIACIVHGLGEHSGRYEHFVQPFTQNNIGIFSIDLRSHGLSEGKRGNGTVSSYVADVQELVITARREFNELPLFLIGHSFGGLLVANFLTKMVSKEISGAILSSAWLELAVPVPKFQYSLASFLKRIYPSMTFSNRLDPYQLANDTATGDKYINDPLVHNKISIRLFFDIVRKTKFVFDKAHMIEIPVLICHGSSDTIISLTGSRKLAEKIPAAELKIWENAKHEPHNDFIKDDVIKYYLDWIKNLL